MEAEAFDDIPSSQRELKAESNFSNADTAFQDSNAGPSTPTKSMRVASTPRQSTPSPSTPKKRGLEDTYHGYVLKLTNVTTAGSPSKSKYFRATLHDGEDLKSVVSYNPNLHPVMKKAKLTDQPVKISQFTEIVNSYDHTKDFKLGNHSTVELSSAPLSFDRVKNLIQESTSMTNMIDAIDQAVGDFVNVEVYVELGDSTIEEVPTRYGVKRKREALIHDASCSVPIRFAIWNAHIDAMPTSGPYRLMDVKINSFNGKYFTTTANTVVSKSAASSLQPMEVSQPQIKTVMSPAKTIDLFEQIYYCPKCNQKSLPSDGPFLKCQNCGGKSLLEDAPTRFNVRLSFEERLTLTVPHDLLQALSLGVNIDVHDEMFQVALLSKKYSIKFSYSEQSKHINKFEILKK
ncbi:uncharacterized protein [Clytia hemisphaerica]